MTEQSGLPFIIMMAATVISSVVMVYAWYKRSLAGAWYLSFVMLAVAISCFASAGELAAFSQQSKIIWSKFSYVGFVSVAPFWLLFATAYCQSTLFRYRIRRAVLWIVPLFTLLLVATNEQNRLIWPAITPVSPAPGAQLIYAHGPGVWLIVVYSYGLILVGSYYLVRTAIHSPQFYKWQLWVLIVATALPWIGNFLYLLNLNPWPGLDLTSLSLSLAGPLIAWSIFHYQALDLTPILTNAMFERLGDGILVLDSRDRIINLNPMAASFLHVGREVLGLDVLTLLPVPAGLLKDRVLPKTHTEVILERNRIQRHYELILTPLNDGRGHHQGTLVLMHDVTQMHALMLKEQQHARIMEVLNAITQIALSSPNLDEMLQAMADHLGELLSADGAFLTIWDNEQDRTVPRAAYGSFRNMYADLKVLPGEVTMTESVLRAGHVVVAEDTLHSPYISLRIAQQFPTRSMLGIPLIADGKKIGAALIAYNEPHIFSSEEIAISEQAGGQIALALAKAQLIDADTRRMAELSALHSITHIISSSLELNRSFENIVKVLQSTFGYSFISIYYLKGDLLHLGSQIGYPAEMINYTLPMTNGIIGRAARMRQTLFVKNVEDDPDFLKASENVHSEIAIPLLDDQRLLGILNVESVLQLTVSDLNLLQAFASQVVIVIKNAEIFQAESEQRVLADAFREIGVSMAKNLDFDDVLDRMIDEIKHVVPYDSATILLVDESDKQARVMRMAGYQQYGDWAVEETRKVVLSIGDTLNLRQMQETRSPMIIPDINNFPGWTYRITSSFIRSWIGAPIIVQDRVVAFFSLNKNESHFFEQEHANRLAIFASQAAIAFENARLYTELQTMAVELEERVRQRTIQLEASNKELEAFAYSVAHDLRSPLRSLDGFSQIVLEDYGPSLDEEGQHLLGLIRGSAQKMGQLINDLLTLSRITRVELSMAAVDMNSVAAAVLSESIPIESLVQFSINLQPLPAIHGDPLLLRQVWTNLISNAVKFTLFKPTRSIEISGHVDKDMTIYQIRDNGAGFNPAYSEKLFGVFQRLHRAEEFEGTGVGLAIVQRIIQRHGGQVWAEGQVGEGASFYFSLPN